MSRQDKATTERHAKTLRELVKRPDNKVCADCKRNDPRWASWNIGVFLCIRCSGIHRSMGTHISKVKSVDLDIWTPEQMESIQKWGNRRANLYWEAHLKAGHVPPDHKMDSFIRSKYESRRWAREGPPPADPLVLDDDAAAPVAPPIQQQSPPPASLHSSSRQGSITQPIVSRQPQGHQLLSAMHSNQPARPVANQAQVKAPAVAPAPAAPAPQNDLFSLDFHAPATPPPHQQPMKNVKSDILSLFSPAPTAPTQPPQQAAFGQFGSGPSPWAQTAAAQPAPQSMMGNAGVGMWGASSGWAPPSTVVTPAQTNVWGAPAVQAQPQQAQQPNLFASSNDVWGSSSTSNPTGASQDLFGSFSSAPAMAAHNAQKKDDAFGDIWGGFK